MVFLLEQECIDIFIKYSYPDLTEEDRRYKQMKFQEIAQEFLDKYRMEEGDTIELLRGYHLAARGGEFGYCPEKVCKVQAKL